jgi:hypothetical protein
MLKKFEISSTKTIAEQSMSLQTLLPSVMEFARRGKGKFIPVQAMEALRVVRG